MKRELLFPALVLVLGVGAIYAHTASFEFVAFDDDTYVTANPVVSGGLSLEGARWAFTAVHGANWHPLTWLSHMLDVELFGLEPGPQHVENAVLHALSAVLLYLFLARATRARWPAFFVAAFFAWHPLRVESVAWVAERKDVLSGVFFMLTLLAYARYTRGPGLGRYLLVAGALVLGLLAKPMLVTLPLVLFLLDLWPLRRVETPASRLVLEKVPLLAIAAGSSLVTLLAQGSSGATPSTEELAPLLRLLNALASYAVYIGQTVWPARLACFYPHAVIVADEPFRALLSPAGVGVLVLAAGTFLALRTWRAVPAVLVGWAWFVVVLLPVIGIVQAGLQAHADRYTYLSSIGLALAAVQAGSWAIDARPGLRIPLSALGLAALFTLAYQSRRQVETWRDSRTLFGHAVAVTDENFRALGNLGHVRREAGEWEGAAEAFGEAARIHPAEPGVLANHGLALLRLGELDRAEVPLRQAVAVEPRNPLARSCLGELAFRAGDYATAVRRFEQALAIDPERIVDLVSLGIAQLRLDRDDEARKSFDAALALDPQHPLPHFGHGEAERKARNWEAARAHLERALELDPRLTSAQASLAVVLERLGDARRRNAVDD